MRDILICGSTQLTRQTGEAWGLQIEGQAKPLSLWLVSVYDLLQISGPNHEVYAAGRPSAWERRKKKRTKPAEAVHDGKAGPWCQSTNEFPEGGVTNWGTPVLGSLLCHSWFDG